MVLKGRKILLGISGSIAAYKSAFLCRLLIKQGAEVKVIMTESATAFVNPLTFATLSGNPVHYKLISEEEWNNHVELGLWADLMLIAPATATTISKMTHGLCDNMLVACYLSAKCPVMIAPAMDLDMWKHPSTKNNLKLLESFGNRLIPVGHGFLASGLHGDGRMAEPEDIVKCVSDYFDQQHDLAHKKILITAGPTYEALDPVRFIGNRSSGKMGYAIAETCAARGAEVHIVSGPVNISANSDKIKITKVQSADEMYQTVSTLYEQYDVVIFAAAVADYKPMIVSDQKIKKSDQTLSLELVKNIDIAATIGKLKHPDQTFIGFALETENEKTNALKKIHTKNFDFIVLNSLKDEGAGFQHDSNKITIIDKSGEEFIFGLKSKSEVAEDIINFLVNNYLNK